MKRLCYLPGRTDLNAETRTHLLSTTPGQALLALGPVQVGRLRSGTFYLIDANGAYRSPAAFGLDFFVATREEIEQ